MSFLLTFLLAASSPADPATDASPDAEDASVAGRAQAVDRYAQLEKLVEAADYLAIGKRINVPESQAMQDADMLWLQRKSMNSHSAYFPMLYGARLWQMADQLDGPQVDQIRQTAVAMLLFTLSIIDIDGARCQDPSAPAGRAQKIMALFPGALDYAHQMDEDMKARIATLVVRLDLRNAGARAVNFDKKFLCFGGMHHIHYGLTHGTTKERRAKDGEFGRQFEVGDGGAYDAPEIAYDKWTAIAGQKRGRLAADLLKMMTEKKD